MLSKLSCDWKAENFLVAILVAEGDCESTELLIMEDTPPRGVISRGADEDAKEAEEFTESNDRSFLSFERKTGAIRLDCN